MNLDTKLTFRHNNALFFECLVNLCIDYFKQKQGFLQSSYTVTTFGLNSNNITVNWNSSIKDHEHRMWSYIYSNNLNNLQICALTLERKRCRLSRRKTRVCFNSMAAAIVPQELKTRECAMTTRLIFYSRTAAINVQTQLQLGGVQLKTTAHATLALYLFRLWYFGVPNGLLVTPCAHAQQG